MALRYAWILFVAFLLAGCTRELDVAQPNTPLGNFEALWQTIDTKYCFVEEKGVDWNSVYWHYKPVTNQIHSAYSDTLFYLFGEMLNRLNDGHVNLYSHFDVTRTNSWYKDYPEIYDEKILYSERYLGEYYRIAGGLHYNVIQPDRKHVIGLIRYSNFSSSISLMPIVLASFQGCDGLIIDVRHNGGGYITNALELASYFYDEEKVIGYLRHKTGEGHNDYSEPEPMKVEGNRQWDKPVVVLQDRRSYSATNLFISAMSQAKNVTLIGCKSGGGGGMPLSYELPNGWLLRFSSVRMTDPKGQSIEDGIKPDIILPWDSTQTNRDTLIDYAIQHIIK